MGTKKARSVITEMKDLSGCHPKMKDKKKNVYYNYKNRLRPTKKCEKNDKSKNQLKKIMNNK